MDAFQFLVSLILIALSSLTAFAAAPSCGPVAASAGMQACRIECEANGCPRIKSSTGTFGCESHCEDRDARMTGAEIVLGCIKGAAWDLPVGIVMSPIYLFQSLVDSAAENKRFVDFCEADSSMQCKTSLAREAAYFSSARDPGGRRVLAQGAELSDVATEDLLRKRSAVRAAALRSQAYQQWLASHGVSAPEREQNVTAADLLYKYAVESLKKNKTEWTCANARERSASICHALGAIGLGLRAGFGAAATTRTLEATAEVVARGQRILGRPLTSSERSTLVTAHELGAGSIGAYTRSDVVAKYRTLRSNFTAAESKQLLKRGVAGTAVDAGAFEAALAFDDRFQTPLETIGRTGREQVAKDLGKYAELAAKPEMKAMVEQYPGQMDVGSSLSRLTPSTLASNQTLTRVSGGLKTDLNAVLAAPDDYMVFYHGTTDASAKAIASRVNFAAGAGEFGPGFYLTASKAQAQSWANLTASSRGAQSGKPVVLMYVFRKSELIEAVNKQSNLAVVKQQGAPAYFENFVELNRRLRSIEEKSPSAASNPSGEIGVLYGPSVSQAENVFNQMKFSDTTANRTLFDANSASVAVFTVP